MKAIENRERASVGQHQGAAMKKGWKTKTLEEVCQFSNGLWKGEKPPFVKVGVIRNTNFTKDGTLDDSGIAYLDVEAKKLEKRRLQFGDIILEKSGGGPKQPVGRVALFNKEDGDFSFSNFTAALRVLDPDDLDFRFVHKFLHWIYVSGVTEGMQSNSTGIRNLDGDAYKTIEISFPSLPEQQRIVGLLDEAFEGLATAKANAEKNLQNARALFESHLQSVFTQRGPGWVETTVGEIGKVSMCKRIFKEETTATGDIPFYKIGTFGKEPDAFIPNQTYNEYRAKYSFPKKGDVLISASGTIGRRVRYDGEPAYFQDSNIVWIDNDEKQALNDYLFHFYGACEWNSSKGATISRLYNDDLRRIAIGFPNSLQEQRRIVVQLDALSEETQRLTRLYEQKLAALEALKKSLLHQAFTGKL